MAVEKTNPHYQQKEQYKPIESAGEEGDLIGEPKQPHGGAIIHEKIGVGKPSPEVRSKLFQKNGEKGVNEWWKYAEPYLPPSNEDLPLVQE